MPLPRFILHAELSLNAKLLYGLILNRSTLSQKNDWVDELGCVYVIYTIRQMAEDLDRSERTVKNALNELENADLLQRVRQGYNQPNKLYLMLPDSAPWTGKICPMEGQEPAPPEGQNLPGNKTEEENNKNKTERRNPLLGFYQNVVLSSEELADLRKDFPDDADSYIEKLSQYMAQSGKQYVSHQAVIRKWIAEDRKPAWEQAYKEGECL